MAITLPARTARTVFTPATHRTARTVFTPATSRTSFGLPINPAAWWHAQDLVDAGGTDGSAVTTWTEALFGLMNGSQSSASAKPILKTALLGGKGIVRFDGVNDCLALNAAALALAQNVAGFTCFVVGKSLSSTTQYQYMSLSLGTVTSVRFQIGRNLTNSGSVFIGARRLDADSGVTVVSAAGAHQALYGVETAFFNYASTTATVYQNGVLKATNAAWQTAGNTSDTISLAGNIGASVVPDRFLNGDIADILVYQRALTAPERNQAERWFGSYYGFGVSNG